jgi:glycosyltransferase involved in cell wall biosynthesis
VSRTVELILFILYLLAGPLTWAFYGVMLYAGHRKMLLLKRPPGPFKVDPPPHVTVLIPAKDEGERIRRCVESALAQDYPSFDVITINDRSADDTGAVMDDLAAAHPGRLRAVHVTDLTPGWTGKNHALYQGAKVAQGDWLLFVDSDVVLEPDVLSASMAVVLRKNFDMISLLPRLESHTVWESLLVPLAAGAAGSMYLIALANNNDLPNTAFANGQFILVKREAYDAIGGHETLKDRYCEDIAMARLLKRNGMRPRVAWGNDFSQVRMYSSFAAIFRGWARIYYAGGDGSPWRILGVVAFLLICAASAYFAVPWGVWRALHPGTFLGGYGGVAWLGAAGLHVALITALMAQLYDWSGNARRNALLFFPLGLPMLLYILFKALRLCATKKLEWRGTTYAHTMVPNLQARPSPAERHSPS